MATKSGFIWLSSKHHCTCECYFGFGLKSVFTVKTSGVVCSKITAFVWFTVSDDLLKVCTGNDNIIKNSETCHWLNRQRQASVRQDKESHIHLNNSHPDGKANTVRRCLSGPSFILLFLCQLYQLNFLQFFTFNITCCKRWYFPCVSVVDKWDYVSVGNEHGTWIPKAAFYLRASTAESWIVKQDLLDDLFSCMVSLFSKLILQMH